MIKALTTTLVLLSAAHCALAAPKKVIILTNDDFNHASGTHEFYAGGLLLKDSLEKSNLKDDLSVEVINNWDGDLAKLQGAAALVHYYKGNKAHLLCQGDNKEKITALAQTGVGQMFVHYGVDCCDDAEHAIGDMTGGYYKDKFSHNPHWTLNAQLQKHPINKGLESYSIYDEWYMNIAFEGDLQIGYKNADTTNQVYSLMYGKQEDFNKGKRVNAKWKKKKLSPAELTVMWAKEGENGGRGVGFTGAHYHKNWADDTFRMQILNAIAWVAKLPVPDEGVTSPKITEEMINKNLDERKKGGLKKIRLAATTTEKTTTVVTVTTETAKDTKPRKPKKEKNPYKKKRSIGSVIKKIHPYFELQNINSLPEDSLKISAMCFHGDDLYVVTFSPDRTNKSPDHQGKLLRIQNVLNADGKGKKLISTVLADGLYEPTGLAIVADSIYVGTKTQILRFDQGVKAKSKMKLSDATVMIDGLSTVNFHTYTVGFEEYKKDGKLYLCGNFTTAIVLGGKRDKMIPPNPEVHRGSTFYFGPVTGKESPQDISLNYLAGGFRTPNGIEVGPDNAVYVADNQGIFNPTNELIRIKPASFYGHYLYNKKNVGRAAAFQPTDIEAEQGGSVGQTGATVHLPQGALARSPAQPHVIRNRTGLLAPYNGQLLLCDFTTGSMLRVFMEEVEGVWQGVAFKHSGGDPDENGNNGFTGGPNRITEGPDGHFYIGQIGAGRLWSFKDSLSGLQRFRVKSSAPSDFNEILAVRVIDGGFELEFLKPLGSRSISANQIKVSQNTYIPTKNYGGSAVGTEKLKVKEIKFHSRGKKATLLIDGLKDASEKYIQTKDGYTSANTGWVVRVQFDPKKRGESLLHTTEFWYTLHKKIGGQDLDPNLITKASAAEEAEAKYKSLCIACHAVPTGAPNLLGILGSKQTVIKANGKKAKVTVDRDYLINAIINPASEKPVKFKDGVMADTGIKKDEAEALVDYILKLK